MCENACRTCYPAGREIVLKLSGIKSKVKLEIPALRHVVAGILGVAESGVTDLEILKLSLDARKKPDVYYVYTVSVTLRDERAVLRRNIPNVSQYTPPEPYAVIAVTGAKSAQTIITGMGPAGLFAALYLAEFGVKCVVLERGQPVEQRICDVAQFWSGGVLNEESNVQFGEGGAGTFSDGKLTTGISDRRIRYVLERLVEFGAPEDILYLSKPHIGTDKLRHVVTAIRHRLIDLGCDIRFGHKLSDVDVADGALCGITVESPDGVYSIAADNLILAPGNSARDTFEMLQKRGFKLTPKNFSVGVRIEHLRRDIDAAQYGSADAELPASDYKLVAHLPNGRAVYTFCVCPGGAVVASSSERGGVVTNGMSEYLRADVNTNGAILVSVTPDDFGNDPMQGIEFQRGLERAAFRAGGEDYRAPAQLLGDFIARRPSTAHGRVVPSYKPGVRFCSLWDVLPEFICDAILQALPEFARKVASFGDADAILTAVETRSSSPVRIERTDFEAVGIRGVFPCGEGAGYAGGIMSAAVDGIKCAEMVKNCLT